MDFKVTERHIEALHAGQKLLRKRLDDSKKGYREFKDRTDHEGIVIRDSYMYFIERDENHLAALNELIKEYEWKLYTKFFK